MSVSAAAAALQFRSNQPYDQFAKTYSAQNLYTKSYAAHALLIRYLDCLACTHATPAKSHLTLGGVQAYSLKGLGDNARYKFACYAHCWQAHGYWVHDGWVMLAAAQSMHIGPCIDAADAISDRMGLCMDAIHGAAVHTAVTFHA